MSEYCCSKQNIDGEAGCYSSYCRSCGKPHDISEHVVQITDLTAELTRLRNENESLTRWRIAFEGLTPNGSEFVNDLERCEAFVRERYAERHEAMKANVRLRQALRIACV